MKAGFNRWLINAPIQKKFQPLRRIIIFLVVLISIFSMITMVMIYNYSTEIITINVKNKEELSAITRNMYVCRVLGRDILLHEDPDEREKLYSQYIAEFENLDEKMYDYSLKLDGEELVRFNEIIEEKDKYKESMILSADIIMDGGDFDEALEALTSVTPIANEFFGSIDDLTVKESIATEEDLKASTSLLRELLIFVFICAFFAITGIAIIFKIFEKAMVSNLVRLEETVSGIAKTGNMKAEIPSDLFTNDEIGSIAKVVEELKEKLLEYSFQDSLTAGLNATAYKEELNDIFSNETEEKDFYCIIADMNNLKEINDVCGHADGDDAIRTTYSILNSSIKQYGKTFRIGGDEFIAIITGCNAETIEKILKSVDERVLKANANNEVKFSIAWGYGRFRGKTLEEYEKFFTIVDKQMYRKKTKMKSERMRARAKV